MAKGKFVGILGVLALAMTALAAAWLPSGEASALKTIDIDTSGYGYGTYRVDVRGEGMNGDWRADAVTFYYYPAYAELVKEDGKYYLDLYYHGDDGSDDPKGEVASMEIKVYYPDSDKEVPFSPIVVTPEESGTSRVELPFAEYGLPEGDYKIEVYAYSRDDVQLSLPYTFIAEYRIEESALVVPDTGGIFQGTNISSTDYLITGLVAFGIIAVAGVVFIIRSDKKKAAKNGRRK